MKSLLNTISTHKNRLSFIFDIDGVIIKSRKLIPRAKEAIELVQKLNIPFVFFTNNLSKSEEFKANQLTNYLTLSTPIRKQQVVLNYTPIRKTMTNWNEKLVLMVARPEVEEILPIAEINNYITVNQYIAMFPQSAPVTKQKVSPSLEVRQRVCKRLGKESLDLHQLKFDLVFILCVPTNWEESMQVIIDLLSTSNGQVSKQRTFTFSPTHIPVITSFNDLLWRKEDHNLPRFLMKPFIVSLKAVFKQIYKEELEITEFGKPSRHAFEFVHKHIDEVFGKSDNYIMVGDNDDVDIKGATEYGWHSILVKTGVSVQESQKATKTCENVEEAVGWAIKQVMGE